MAEELRLVLQGELVEPWSGELRSLWEAECRSERNRRCVVDLNDITRIDESGKRLLALMNSRGAELLASGVATKHFIRGLKPSGL